MKKCLILLFLSIKFSTIVYTQRIEDIKKIELVNELRLKIDSISKTENILDFQIKLIIKYIDSIQNIYPDIFYFTFLKGEYLTKLNLFDKAILEFQKCLKHSKYYYKNQENYCKSYKNISEIYKIKNEIVQSEEYDKKFIKCLKYFKLKKNEDK